jgi:uncharacterized membrane protein YeaQ/YmgE (transglycosylase-associated protein family)
MDAMGWLSWIIIGALVGWIASMVMNTGRQIGWVVDMIVGIVGAIAGGLIFFWVASPTLTAFNIWSLLVAFIGAVILIGLERLIDGSRRQPTA